MQSRKGMSISLAALYAAVGRRLGFQLLPATVPSKAQDLSNFGISLATAPTPDPWLIRASTGNFSFVHIGFFPLFLDYHNPHFLNLD